MRQLIIITLTLLTVTSFGQVKDSVDSIKIIFVTESMPEYPGGNNEMFKFLKKNLKCSKDSKDTKGKVYIGFTVNKDGSLSDFKVVKGLAESLDNCALETVKMMPNWIPAKSDNKPIQVKMVLPITFDK